MRSNKVEHSDRKILAFLLQNFLQSLMITFSNSKAKSNFLKLTKIKRVDKNEYWHRSETKN